MIDARRFRRAGAAVSCTRTSPPLATPPLVTLPPPLVTLADGALEGTRVAGDVVAFLGIPYAAAPVVALRWRPPEPPSPWPGTRTAKQFGAACRQLPARAEIEAPNRPASADQALAATSVEPGAQWFHLTARP